MKLMVVDDERSVSKSLKEALEPGGYDCSLFENPADALKNFQHQYYDAVITDYRMPGMDGNTLLKEIQQIRPGTPVVIITGYADVQNAIDAVNYGAYAFFQKPINISAFIKTLEEIDSKLNMNIADSMKQSGANQLARKLTHELHHRVKNSVKLIESMISLQQNFATNPQAVDALFQVYNRIHAINLVHERMYHFQDVGKLNLALYIQKFMNDLKESFRLKRDDIVLDAQLNQVYVDMDSAVSWGLVINELMTNIMKHAFPPDFRGTPTIQIRLGRNESNQIDFSVCDNGIGIDENFKPEQGHFLGLYLVSMITKQQLGGTFHIISDQGTACSIVV